MPDEWRFDLGYSPSAVDFAVTGLCVLLVDTTQNSYDYVLISPTGQQIPVPAVVVFGPLTPMSSWGNPAAPFGGLQGCWNQIPTIPSAKGIWRIQLFQKPGFTGKPTNGSWASGVSDVQLYNSPVEGILAVQFTGNEVLPTTTTTTTTTTTSTTTTTTTSGPTTSSTTTSAPTTTTTTTAPTTTTSTTSTTAAPGGGGSGCLCLAAVIIALILIAAAAIMLFIWACGGFYNLALLTAAVSSAALALIILSLWILLCRDCAAIFLLIDWFTRLSLLMLVIAAVLAIIFLFGCAAGALIVGGLFGTVLAVLNFGRGLVGCTR